MEYLVSVGSSVDESRLSPTRLRSIGETHHTRLDVRFYIGLSIQLLEHPRAKMLAVLILCQEYVVSRPHLQVHRTCTIVHLACGAALITPVGGSRSPFRHF